MTPSSTPCALALPGQLLVRVGEVEGTGCIPLCAVLNPTQLGIQALLWLMAMCGCHRN
ncbi:MAG: hypothetical protein OEU26_35590 [Candidatus Tectomicrobia bacterium]|nr:hypothetical protein [Candidatus Tectomicrobia bacterium]